MMDTADLLVQKIDLYSAQVLAREEKLNTGMTDLGGKVAGLGARIGDLEQKLAGGFGGGGGREYKSIGERVIDDEAVKALARNGGRGSARVVVATKALSSISASAGSFVAPDRQNELITLARRVPRIRSLLAPGETTSNVVHFVKENVVTNAAAMVAEGAEKPESNITYEADETSVRTLAHWIKASNQILADAPQLQSIIDTSLRYMLDTVEDTQLLSGSGSGENLTGLITAATAYASPWTSVGDTRIDVILKAIAQCETGSQLPCTGIILNSLDWAQMLGIKTDDGDYLSGGPFSANPPTLWGRPVVATTAMTAGQFVVLNGTQAAQIFDRMETEVIISSEHADLFIRNQVAIRAEKRLALVIKRPLAIVHGTFPV
jgi:HK97 family phage major capsid protein